MREQRGNILFLILLAIILFVALSYAVTSGMRGAGKDAGGEDMQGQVSVLENQAIQIKTALQRMETTGGYPLWKIDYADASTFSSSNNTCSSAGCRLFDPAGGGVSGYILPARLQSDPTLCTQAVWDGKAIFRNVGIKNTGSDQNRELLLLYPGVSRALCTAVNQKYGVNAPLTSPGDQDNYQNAANCEPRDYNGTYIAEPAEVTDGCNALGDTDSSLIGKPMFCVTKYSHCYFLYYVLKER